MGSSFSNSKFSHGELALKLDYPYCFSGTFLTGRIFLELSRPYPAEAVCLQLKGCEEASWRHGKHDDPKQDSDGSKVHHQIKDYFESHEYKCDAKNINREYYIYQFNDEYIPPGQYVFPFSIMIPKSCPSSAMYSGKLNSSGKIKYSIEVILKPMKTMKIGKIAKKLPLILIQEPSISIPDLITGYEGKVKKFLWFFNKGTAKLKTKVDKTVYCFNEIIKVQCDIDKAEFDIENLKILILNYVLIK